MSRIGKLPVKIPKGVTVTFNAASNEVGVKGPKGTLTQWIDKVIEVKIEKDKVLFSRSTDERTVRGKHGLYRVLVQNMVTGVTQGFEKVLEINGVGFKADIKDNLLILNLGFSHSIEYPMPKGIECKVIEGKDKVIRVHVSGTDKVLVGQVAANIRRFRKADVYHMKGVKYVDEVIKKKATKTGK